MIRRRKSLSDSKIPLVSSLLNHYLDSLIISKIFAIISALNFGLVIFDITYIPLRDIWLNGKITLGKFKMGPYEYKGINLKIIPTSVSNFLVQYDLIKGIQPHRDTQAFLDKYNSLKQTIYAKGLESPEAEAIIAELRQASDEMITSNPFALAGKTGTLETIKNRMRDYMKNYIYNPQDSSRIAFTSFWNREFLAKNTQEKLRFFDNQIIPLIRTNFFRPFSESGEFVDYFGLIDFPFIAVILADFVIRCFGISLRYRGVSFKDAILWRWYDLIFLLPRYRWLRIVPVMIRLDESKIVSLEDIKKQASQGFVATVAEDITEIVVLRIFNQVQKLIETGSIERLVISQNPEREYIDLNDINEVAEISKILVNLIVEEILPQIRSEVEALLAYILEKTLKESPIYNNIIFLNDGEKIVKEISQKTAAAVYRALGETLNKLREEDKVFEQHLTKIFGKIGDTINLRPRAKQDINKIEGLLVALLEEVKVNYIMSLAAEDIESILDEKRALLSGTKRE
ncbi:MAG: hypothetical protein N3D76_01440 [Geminocystis sp.]|nr:hypothetical protein [Geminocystis sp.]HIK37886.1 hypothetical protein [Geminocystis sp. M7585_C2015_104]